MFAVILIVLLIIGAVVSASIFGSSKEALTKKLSQLKLSNDARSYIESTREDLDKVTALQIVIPIICIVLAVIIFVVSSISIVPTGHTGIKTTFGKVENDVLPSGINFKAPWQSVINMDNREQRFTFALEAFSKDIQQVDIQGSINVNINKETAMNLYKDVGVDYIDILVKPRIQEVVKVEIAKYTAENLIANRQKASDQIFEDLKGELSEKGINAISFQIENIDFTDAYEKAVEAKQVATQEKQKAQTEQEKKTMEQKEQAERDRIKAQAAADVKKINADAAAYAVSVQAEAQAKANEELAATLSDGLIRYNTVQKWDGKLPVVSSEGASNIIDIRNLLDEPEKEEKEETKTNKK